MNDATLLPRAVSTAHQNTAVTGARSVSTKQHTHKPDAIEVSTSFDVSHRFHNSQLPTPNSQLSSAPPHLTALPPFLRSPTLHAPRNTLLPQPPPSPHTTP